MIAHGNHSISQGNTHSFLNCLFLQSLKNTHMHTLNKVCACGTHSVLRAFF